MHLRLSQNAPSNCCTKSCQSGTSGRAPPGRATANWKTRRPKGIERQSKETQDRTDKTQRIVTTGHMQNANFKLRKPQMLKCSNAQWSKCSNAQMIKWSNAPNAPMLKCSMVKNAQWSNGRMLKSSDANCKC